MFQLKDVVYEVKVVARRRIKLLIIIPILFLGISIAATYMIEPRYMSSTSILVQKDETLNPLVMYEMAVNTVSEDRLQSFNEIVYSRTAMEMLIDSLGLEANINSQNQKQVLIEKLKSNIETSLKASDSFQIIYYDTDPVRARDAVQYLASHFIKTRLELENNETVNFFSDKLVEMENVVEQQREMAENVQTDRLRTQPVQTEALQERLQAIQTEIDDIDWYIYENEQKLNIIKKFQATEGTASDIQLLYELPLSGLQYGDELAALMNEHDQLSQQFTESYPRLQSLSRQISQVVDRISPIVERNIEALKVQKNELSRQRLGLLNDMEKSFVATQRATTQQSDFSIYEGLLADIKVKLEQAKMTRDIGERAAEQFVVLDAPYIPEQPSKPDKKLIVAAGLFLGIVFGVAMTALAEVMDTTIRTEEDLPYNKPIVAYLTHGPV